VDVGPTDVAGLAGAADVAGTADSPGAADSPGPIDWAGRTVLITGAAGFLGGSVARRLREYGARVIGLDIDWGRAPSEQLPVDDDRIDGDIRDTVLVTQVLADHRVDTVIHLAAQTLVGPAVADPANTFSHNVGGSWSVLEACRTAGAGAGRLESIVLASSDKAYGDWSGRPYREEMALRAKHPYDASKAAMEVVAGSYAATYDLPLAMTRCGNLYGGGDLNWSRLVPGTIRSVLDGQPPLIRSDGTPVRDYLHVSDGAAGVLALATALRDRPEVRGEAFNFAAGSRVSAIDLVRRILALMGSHLEPVILAEALHEIPEQRLSTARAKRLLGWQPTVSIGDGLREAIVWYRGHLAGGG
jgi:CDP-glucose 4,6-dehydratase